jgi:hypothetical protein
MLVFPFAMPIAIPICNTIPPVQVFAIFSMFFTYVVSRFVFTIVQDFVFLVASFKLLLSILMNLLGVAILYGKHYCGIILMIQPL